jgi:hypothetical protein
VTLLAGPAAGDQTDGITMPPKQLACLLMGDESLLVQCAETLCARGHVVAAFVTEEEPIRNWAKPLGIEVLAPDKDLQERLAGIRYDWFFGIANLRIVPEPVWR